MSEISGAMPEKKVSPMFSVYAVTDVPGCYNPKQEHVNAPLTTRLAHILLYNAAIEASIMLAKMLARVLTLFRVWSLRLAQVTRQANPINR